MGARLWWRHGCWRRGSFRLDREVNESSRRHRENDDHPSGIEIVDGNFLHAVSVVLPEVP